MHDEIIKNYYNLGLIAQEIALFFVSVHGIGISLRQLKRILRRLWSTRRRRRIHVVSRQCSLAPSQVASPREGTPLYGLYRYVRPHRVWFLSRFGHKLGIDFSHFAAILVINRASIFALQSSIQFFFQKKLLLHHALFLPSALCLPLPRLTLATQTR